MIVRAVSALLLVLSLMGCAGLTQSEQRVLSGGAIGAGLGTAGAFLLGGPLIVGAAVGTAAGAAGGLIVEQLQSR